MDRIEKTGIRLPLAEVDAFPDRLFGGNPAAVVPLESWLPDATLQAIAMENNLSETAYAVREGDGWRLRWFTPAVEVDLCGHATLATAHFILPRVTPGSQRVSFATRSGLLEGTRTDDDRLALDFPTRPAAPVADSATAAPVAHSLAG